MTKPIEDMMSNAELAEAIKYANEVLANCPPSSNRYPVIMLHFTTLLQIQRARAAKCYAPLGTEFEKVYNFSAVSLYHD